LNRLSELRRSWSRQDEESRNAALLVAGISFVILLALAIVGYGYIKDRQDNRGNSVLVVGKWDVSYDYLVDRMKPFMPGTGTYTPDQFSQLLGGILAQIEQEELMRYTAREQGITVGDDEIEQQMRDDLDVSADASKEVFATALRRQLLTTGLSLDEYRAIQRAQLIENKVRGAARDALPAQTEQVDIRLLKVATQADADAAKTRLNNGESLAVVAADVSIDTSKSKAGDVDWVARGSYESKLEDAIFSQAVGTISDVIVGDEGFYIVEVRGHETRDTTDEIRNAVASRTFNTDLQEGRDAIGSQITMTTTQVNQLATDFRSSLNIGG
jgi:hypothetical protein